MTMLETKIESGIEAADSRFFVAPEPTETTIDRYHRFSERFYLQNSDLLVSDTANLVLQTGIDSSGQPAEIGEDGANNISVVFDQSLCRHREYMWGLTIAKPGKGRETAKIKLTSSDVVAKNCRYDSQGVLRGEDIIDAADSMAIIARFVKSDKFASYLLEKRLAQARAEDDLSRFSVRGIGQYSEQKYLKILAGKEAAVKKIGFLSTQAVGL